MAFETTDVKIREAGNGSKVAFDFGFKIFNASDLVVSKVNQTTGIETACVLGVDYTVAINPTTDGGTVTYSVAPASGYDSFIRRVMALTQTADIPSNNIFREVQIENALDKAMMVCQQLQEQLDRTVKMPVTSSITDLIFSTPEAGKAIVWNATEDGFENSDVDLQSVADTVQDLNSAVTAAETARDEAVAAAGSFAFASQAEAEAGTNQTKNMNPLRTAQAIAALQRAIASQAEAEAGVENTKVMTALRTAQAIAALKPVFGAWASKSGSTVYQAATDGFVLAVFVATPTGNGYIYTDSSNPPTTYRQRLQSGISVGVINISSVSPVKKGDFWKVAVDGTYTVESVYWLPSGN